MLRIHPIYSAVLCALTAPLALAAGETQPAKPVLLPEVTAVDQRDAQIERKKAGLQKIVIAEEEVERYGDATVGDVLRRLPGMTFTGPAGVSKDVRMRGLDKGYTQFLINGEQVPGLSQERQMQVDRLPADMIERIEIIRSPSAEYDASGIGGTINIVLKQKAENLTRLRAAWGKNGRLDVGDVIAQWSRRIDNLDVVLAVSHTVGAEDVVEDKQKYNALGVVTEREHKPKPVKKTETLFTPRLTWRLGSDKLILDPYFSSGTEDKEENSEVRNGAGVTTKFTGNHEKKTDEMGRLGGRYEGVTGWGQWFAKAAYQTGVSRKDKYGTEANGLAVLTKRNQEDERIEEDTALAGAGVVVPLGSHTVKAGFELRQTDYEKTKAVHETPGGCAPNCATAPLNPKAPGANDIYRIEEGKTIFYLQDEWRLAANHWLTPGVRFERVKRDATDRNGGSRSAAQQAPNPSLHYRWAMLPNTNLRASYAQTMRMPKFDDVNPLVTLATGGGAGGINNPDKAGNAALKPEYAKGFELGVEQFFFGNRGLVGLNLYHRDVSDFIQKESRLEGARYVQRPYNVGDAQFWGAELDWRVPLVRKGPHELTLTGSHAELRGRVRNLVTGDYGDVKDLPPRVTNLGLDWRHTPSRWAGGFTVNYQPAYTTDGLNADGVREVKIRNASTLLDLYITKAFSPLAELRLIAKNVLSVKKDESTTKYNTNGSFNSAESKIERSRPTIFLAFESRF